MHKPLVIGHRGASGYLPEHTLAAYYIAIEQGADCIEPDLVMTMDGVLVARHENEIGGTTDVARHSEFANRRTTKTIDGTAITGWFTEDFTLAELKTLRAKERIPGVRADNMRFDAMFAVPTLEEVLQFVAAINACRRKDAKLPNAVRVYPETKHPTYFQHIGLPLEAPLVNLLDRYGYHGGDAAVFIQSFEVANLQALATMTQVPLVQLLNAGGRPYDFAIAGDVRTYADLVQPAGLAEIARYARGIGANKNLVIPRTADDRLGMPTALIKNAHAAGLVVHGWTFRAENTFLPAESRCGSEPNARGDLAAEIRRFLELGMDGIFTDQPDIGARVRDAFVGMP